MCKQYIDKKIFYSVAISKVHISLGQLALGVWSHNKIKTISFVVWSSKRLYRRLGSLNYESNINKYLEYVSIHLKWNICYIRTIRGHHYHTQVTQRKLLKGTVVYQDTRSCGSSQEYEKRHAAHKCVIYWYRKVA